MSALQTRALGSEVNCETLPLCVRQVTFCLKGSANLLDNTSRWNPMSTKKAFISYNHEDRDIAEKLKSALETHHILVTIDNVAMRASQDIEEFIEGSILDADITLSVVSNRSLLSGWVALESIAALYRTGFPAWPGGARFGTVEYRMTASEV